MTAGYSFTDYVKSKFYYGLFQTAEEYIPDNIDPLNLHSKNGHSVGEVELMDAEIHRAYVNDLPGSTISFEVLMELQLTVKEGNRHYDECD